MQTLQSLLDQFGKPPPEICLDWAWQLDRLESPKIHDKPAIAFQNRTWNDVGIDEAGILTLLNLEIPGPTGSLVSQLIAWSSGSQGGESDKNVAESSSNDRTLETLGAAEQLRRATWQMIESEAFRQESKPIVRTSVAPTENAKRTAVGKKNDLQHKLGEQAGRNARGIAKRRTPTASFQKLRIPSKRVLIGTIAGVAIIGIAWLAMRGSENSTKPEIAAAPSSESKRLSQSKSDSHKSSADENPTTDIDHSQIALATSDDLVSAPTESTSADIQPLESLNSFDVGKSLSGLNDPSPTTNSAQPAAAVVDSAPKAMKNDSPLTTEKTVMEEIQTATKKADAEMQEISVAANESGNSTDANDSSAVAGAVQAPLVIDCGSMRQVFRLKDELSLKPREPVWKMRLVATEGFVVEPAGAQQLAPRGTLSWTIYDSEAKPPRTRIVVQAQQASGRKGDVQWRLFGTAEDLPMLSLPLSRQWLDPLRDRLKQFEQFVRVTLDQLQQQSRQPGLPSQARALLTSQRQWADQQSKMLERALTVTAETDRLVALVDGQFEVHGQLQDGAGETAPVLLKFGSIEALPVAEPTPENPANDQSKTKK